MKTLTGKVVKAALDVSKDIYQAHNDVVDGLDSYTGVEYHLIGKKIEELNILFVGFRGSEQRLNDWITNLYFNETDDGLHGGWYLCYKTIEHQLLSFLKGKRTLDRYDHIIFVGHSRGGAIAAIAYNLVIRKMFWRRKDFHCITFGAPSVSTGKNYVTNSDSTLISYIIPSVLHIACKKDPVPFLTRVVGFNDPYSLVLDPGKRILNPLTSHKLESYYSCLDSFEPLLDKTQQESTERLRKRV